GFFTNEFSVKTYMCLQGQMFQAFAQARGVGDDRIREIWQGSARRHRFILSVVEPPSLALHFPELEYRHCVAADRQWELRGFHGLGQIGSKSRRRRVFPQNVGGRNSIRSFRRLREMAWPRHSVDLPRVDAVIAQQRYPLISLGEERSWIASPDLGHLRGELE